MDGGRLCASPTCFCETDHFTCSLWCGSLDIPAGTRCLCRHDECLRTPAGRAPLFAAGDRPHAAAAFLVSGRRAAA
jgi:hypothetical protein